MNEMYYEISETRMTNVCKHDIQDRFLILRGHMWFYVYKLLKYLSIVYINCNIVTIFMLCV